MTFRPAAGFAAGKKAIADPEDWTRSTGERGSERDTNSLAAVGRGGWEKWRELHSLH